MEKKQKQTLEIRVNSMVDRKGKFIVSRQGNALVLDSMEFPEYGDLMHSDIVCANKITNESVIGGGLIRFCDFPTESIMLSESSTTYGPVQKDILEKFAARIFEAYEAKHPGIIGSVLYKSPWTQDAEIIYQRPKGEAK